MLGHILQPMLSGSGGLFCQNPLLPGQNKSMTLTFNSESCLDAHGTYPQHIPLVSGFPTFGAVTGILCFVKL